MIVFCKRRRVGFINLVNNKLCTSLMVVCQFSKSIECAVCCTKRSSKDCLLRDNNAEFQDICHGLHPPRIPRSSAAYSKLF